MKTCSSAFKAHLAGEITTLATCWRAELKTGAIYGFTDHTRDITFDGQLYESSTGYTPSAVDTSAALNVDNLEVEAILTADVLNEADLLSGVWDYAEIEIFWVNYNDLTMGRMILKTGTLGEVTLKRSSFIAEVRGLTQAYTTALGELSSPTCRVHELGDARCKKDLTGLSVTGTVDGVDPTGRIIVDAARTEAGAISGTVITDIIRGLYTQIVCPGHSFVVGEVVTISEVVGVRQDGAVGEFGMFYPGSFASINGSMFTIISIGPSGILVNLDTRTYNADPIVGQTDASKVYSAYVSGGKVIPQGLSSVFDYGKVVFTSGQNAGLSMEVKAYVPGTIILQLPMPYPIAPGDGYTLTQGCDRAFNTCKNRYNNVVNFRGEPHLPGQDKVYSFGGTQ